MSEVMESLSAVLDDFDQVIRAAHTRYREYPAEVLIEHSARAAATCTYDHIVAEADRRFLDREDLRTIEVRGLKIWLVGMTTAVRFKKMGEDGSTRNYPTQQALDFDRGAELPGLPPAPVRVSVGYLLDPTGVELIRTQVARPAGRGVSWCAAVVPVEKRTPGEQIWRDVTQQRGW